MQDPIVSGIEYRPPPVYYKKSTILSLTEYSCNLLLWKVYLTDKQPAILKDLKFDYIVDLRLTTKEN